MYVCIYVYIYNIYIYIYIYTYIHVCVYVYACDLVCLVMGVLYVACDVCVCGRNWGVSHILLLMSSAWLHAHVFISVVFQKMLYTFMRFRNKQQSLSARIPDCAPSIQSTQCLSSVRHHPILSIHKRLKEYYAILLTRPLVLERSHAPRLCCYQLMRDCSCCACGRSFLPKHDLLNVCDCRCLSLFVSRVQPWPFAIHLNCSVSRIAPWLLPLFVRLNFPRTLRSHRVFHL